MSKSENRAGRKLFDIIRVFALIAGLVFTGCQTSNQNMIMPDNQENVSTNDVILISRELDKPKYAGIISAIDYHASDYPIRTSESHKRFSDSLLIEYLGRFEKVGVLARDKVVNPVMAYEELGFELEKTWCNNDVQRYINDARNADKQSSDARDKYSAFEELAKYCLEKDKKTCSDMDKEQLLQQQ